MHLKQTPLQWPEFLKLLAHDIRWSILLLLARSDYRGLELVQKLRHPQNLISYHLRQLMDAQLVSERRSSADARDIYYSLNIDMLSDNYFAAARVLHPAMDVNDTCMRENNQLILDRPVRVLFLCTKNSARSQMAEGLLRHMSNGHIEVSSAGTEPDALHPLAVHVMEQMNIDIHQQQSKHMDTFKDQSFDYIVTVCDRVREACPAVSSETEHLHWSIPDPAQEHVSEEERRRLFEHVVSQIQRKVYYFLSMIEQEHHHKNRS